MGNYIGKEPVNGFFTRQSLTTDGSTVTFTLNFTIASTTSILVLAGGVCIRGWGGCERDRSTTT